MSEDIRLCICGKEASIGTIKYSAKSDIAKLNGQRLFYFVNCEYCGWNNCGAVGFKTRENAVDNWNNRPIEDKLESENKELTGINDEIIKAIAEIPIIKNNDNKEAYTRDVLLHKIYKKLRHHKTINDMEKKKDQG